MHYIYLYKLGSIGLYHTVATVKKIINQSFIEDKKL